MHHDKQMSNVPSIQAILMFFSGLESPHKPSLNLHPEQYLVIHHKFHYLHQCCFAWDMNEAVHQKTRWMPKEWRDGGLVSSWNIDAPNVRNFHVTYIKGECWWYHSAQTQHGKLMFVMVNPVQWKAWVVSVQESGRGEGLQMNDDGNEG